MAMADGSEVFNSFGSEEENFNWWVQKLTREAHEIREGLNKLSGFESEIQKAEFIKQLNGKFYGKVSLGVVKVKTKRTDDNFYPPVHLCFADWRTDQNYRIYEIKDFLLAQSKDWGKAAEEMGEQLATVLPEASKIRRNILYPEVAEMEKEIRELKTELEQAKICLKGLNDLVKYKEFRLAEKEKEIGESKGELELLIGRVSRSYQYLD